MGITVKYSNGIVIHYKNIPDTIKFQLHGTPSTLSAVPEGYKFIKEENPFTTITLEEEEATSLSV